MTWVKISRTPFSCKADSVLRVLTQDPVQWELTIVLNTQKREILLWLYHSYHSFFISALFAGSVRKPFLFPLILLNTQQFSRFYFWKQKQTLSGTLILTGSAELSLITFQGSMVIFVVGHPPFYPDVIGQVECATWTFSEVPLSQACHHFVHETKVSCSYGT